MKKAFLASALFLIVNAWPVHASSIDIGSFTIDSTNCNSSAGCYGLEWTLGITQLTSDTLINGVLYDAGMYVATLDVQDDPNVDGALTNYTISAVDFKVSSSTIDSAYLAAAPSSSSGWVTGVNVLNSNGCKDNSNPGFVCSQTASDPATFSTGQSVEWIWVFSTTGAIDLDGAHIGAKMTDLTTKGKLLSATYSVPEPGTLTLLATGLAAAVVARIRRRKSLPLRTAAIPNA